MAGVPLLYWYDTSWHYGAGACGAHTNIPG
jgi:hypothetical protein